MNIFTIDEVALYIYWINNKWKIDRQVNNTNKRKNPTWKERKNFIGLSKNVTFRAK